MIAAWWVRKIKADGTYESCLVVQGWSQVPEIDRGLNSTRMMLAIPVEPNYEVFMLDVQIAFLNAGEKKDDFASMAQGYEIASTSGIRLVMTLKKKYVLFPAEAEDLVRHHGQSPRQIGSRRLKSDLVIYVFEDDTDFFVLALYVDGFLVLGANKQLLKKLKKTRMDRFERADMGDVLRLCSALT